MQHLLRDFALAALLYALALRIDTTFSGETTLKVFGAAPSEVLRWLSWCL